MDQTRTPPNEAHAGLVYGLPGIGVVVPSHGAEVGVEDAAIDAGVPALHPGGLLEGVHAANRRAPGEQPVVAGAAALDEGDVRGPAPAGFADDAAVVGTRLRRPGLKLQRSHDVRVKPVAEFGQRFEVGFGKAGRPDDLSDLQGLSFLFPGKIDRRAGANSDAAPAAVAEVVVDPEGRWIDMFAGRFDGSRSADIEAGAAADTALRRNEGGGRPDRCEASLLGLHQRLDLRRKVNGDPGIGLQTANVRPKRAEGAVVRGIDLVEVQHLPSEMVGTLD